MFIDYVTADGSIRINSEAYRAILSAHIQTNSTNLIGWRLIVQMYNDPKHFVKVTQNLFKAQKKIFFSGHVSYLISM